jgi:hypothetical protein
MTDASCIVLSWYNFQKWLKTKGKMIFQP